MPSFDKPIISLQRLYSVESENRYNQCLLINEDCPMQCADGDFSDSCEAKPFIRPPF